MTSHKEITYIRVWEIKLGVIKPTKEHCYACTSQSKVRVTMYVELYTIYIVR